MKSTKMGFKMLVAGGALLSVVALNSCSKMQDAKSPVQDNSVDNASAVAPIAQWGFDSAWTESVQHLKGKPHSKVKFSTTTQAHAGKAAFLSKDSGYVSYDDAGTAIPNLTTGLTVDFWVYASAKEGGAQCIFCIPQTVDQNGQPAFWPNMHVLLDGYNSSQGDSGLIKVMFKANKNIDYNERWEVVGGIPKFYGKWSHVQYSYSGKTSKFTLIVNGKTLIDHVIQYTDGTNTTKLGNLVANPGSHGVVIGAFQNRWDPVLFGAPQSWMLPFEGRIDDLKIYNSALF